MIPVHSRHTPLDKIAKKYPGHTVVDVTSRGPEPWVRFSPFFPHGGIPVPGRDETGASVEGIWQGLKVFESHGVDPDRWANTSMKGLKRTVRKYGRCIGHRYGDALLDYRESRYRIYLPTYRWALENRLVAEVEALRALRREGPVVLLDYETNGDPDDLSRPLSHAALVGAWVEGRWPAPSEMAQGDPHP
ncbi:MAG: hypothetical protein H6737_21880 [Alphaproteobacteria bacterium]|nr:hypothetical protein [Alphaproteobacteria bacterium]